MTTRRRPTPSPPTFEFDKDGKKKVIVAEVRHWISNHEAGLGRPGDSNTIGDIFYGSNGYLAVENNGKYATYLGREQQPGPARSGGREQLAELHRHGPLTQVERSECAHR